MERGNKKILVAALLVLLLAVSFSTYAIYRSSITGTATATAAKWSVKVNGTSAEEESFTFGSSDITWTTNPGKEGTIAPGATGYIDVEIDATGSQVDVAYSVEIDSAELSDGITATLDSSNGSTIAYNATSMKATARINVTWSGSLDDTATKDAADKDLQSSTINIPVKVTVRQAL